MKNIFNEKKSEKLYWEGFILHPGKKYFSEKSSGKEISFLERIFTPGDR